MSAIRSLQMVLDQHIAWIVEHPETVREALKLGADAAVENVALRKEVNALLAKCGMGRKYVEWDEHKTTGGCPVSGG